MNLNQYMKQAIVRSVIADIPRKYSSASKNIDDAAQVIVNEDVRKHAPKEIQTLWASKELQPWLSITGKNMGYLTVDGTYRDELPYVRVPLCHKFSKNASQKFTDLANETLQEFKAIDKARQGLTAALAPIRTRKQFLAQFPELEKYLPPEPEKGRMLPAIANVMADLTKMGWPKDKQAVAA